MPNIAAMWLDARRFAPEVAPAVVIFSDFTRDSDLFVPDSRRAWLRLAVAVLIGSLGSVGMWSVVVALPVVQTEFTASRGFPIVEAQLWETPHCVATYRERA